MQDVIKYGEVNSFNLKPEFLIYVGGLVPSAMALNDLSQLGIFQLEHESNLILETYLSQFKLRFQRNRQDEN